MLTPRPTQLDGPLRSERQIHHHRRLDCARYRECLDESVRQSWESFSCVGCPLASGAASDARQAELRGYAQRRTTGCFGMS